MVRHRSDELAVDNGCAFDAERGTHAVWWIERFCRLYEGATGPLRLRGCHTCGDYGLPDLTEGTTWDENTQLIAKQRLLAHLDCVKKGHDLDWQYDVILRIFGWVRYSEDLERMVRRFRKGTIFVPKKNKKSPTLAAVATYLLIGEGEQGQKVYLCAKDGAQARDIAGSHLIKMVEQSPELASACQINKNLMRVTHLASSSWTQPMSSSNERNQKAKEGWNGSVLIDETHVVDREYVGRISRAGISREEPLHLEFSTAGDDPDSYGKEIFDYAVKVIAGEVDDETFFGAIYAAPQNLSDEELARDPLKYARMANPAWGHTVRSEEWLADYRSSRTNPREFARFKKYRLNIWQNSASPWLSQTGWAAGARNILLDDYKGRECWAALDLASVRDFTALTLCFPEAEEELTPDESGEPRWGRPYTFFWWFWLPEETKREYGDRIAIDKWLKETGEGKCSLKLTPGARIDPGYITATFRQLAKRFDIQQLLYDRWNAEVVTQQISDGVFDGSHQVVEGTGVERVEFSQGIATMNEPTKHFEALVLDGLCRHNGDPIARWMAGNATVKTDANNNYKPVKPPFGDIKKIDGIVTAVMALAGAEQGGGGSIFNAYDTYGSVAL